MLIRKLIVLHTIVIFEHVPSLQYFLQWYSALLLAGFNLAFLDSDQSTILGICKSLQKPQYVLLDFMLHKHICPLGASSHYLIPGGINWKPVEWYQQVSQPMLLELLLQEHLCHVFCSDACIRLLIVSSSICPSPGHLLLARALVGILWYCCARFSTILCILLLQLLSRALQHYQEKDRWDLDMGSKALIGGSQTLWLTWSGAWSESCRFCPPW